MQTNASVALRWLLLGAVCAASVDTARAELIPMGVAAFSGRGDQPAPPAELRRNLAAKLQTLGATSQAIGERMDALSDDEIVALADDSDNAPAGGFFTDAQLLALVVIAVAVWALIIWAISRSSPTSSEAKPS